MDDLSATLADFTTPVLSDALDELGVGGVLYGCALQTHTSKTAVGSALPVRFVPMESDPEAYRFGGGVGRPLEEVLKRMVAGQIVVFDLNGTIEVACWGGLASQLALSRGVRGVVIWGCCRDVDEIDALGFPVWAVGKSPRRSRNSFTFGSIGEPIDVSGTRVSAEDIIVGDSNGVVVVPQDVASDVITLAVDIQRSEERMIQQIGTGSAEIDWDQV